MLPDAEQNLTFFQFLEKRVRAVDSLLCVGLDPHPADLPEWNAKAARDFCLRLIEATADAAAAFKPNAAFFEALGAPGMGVLREVIAAVPRDIPVILDAKRGDIASTAEAYARAAFETWGAHAVTVSPYLGGDALAPFLSEARRGVFLLCKTSNPGAQDLQDLPLAAHVAEVREERLFERVARLATIWNTRDNLGLVVGATHPEALRRVRALAPGLWLLAPGVGAQGGDLAGTLEAGLRSDGLGLLVTVSRGVARAPDPGRAARELQAEMAAFRRSFAYSRDRERADATRPEAVQALSDALLAAGCVRFGRFTLKSGLESPIYIDLRQLISHPPLLAEVARAYLPLLRGLSFDRLAALPYAAIPIATAISLQAGWPLIYPRKEAKEYGTRSEIEGQFFPGEAAVVIDDLATTGGSKFEAIEKLTAAGLKVRDVVVLIDRQSGAVEALASAGYHLHAVLRLREMLDHWEQSGQVEAGHIQATRAFLAG